jgi:CBS domain-containing protein
MKEISIGANAQRLVIYIGEADRWRGKPLYAAILDTLRAHGLAGATVVRGVAGFGAHSRLHTASILRLSEDLPLRIEVVDSHEKIAQALEFIAPMVTEGLITLDEVSVVRYTHRYLHPLPADRPVGDVMTREVITLTPDMTLAQAWDRMLQYSIKALPVVDSENVVVGMLTDQDILSRAGLGQRLSVAERLDHAILKQELQRLDESALRVRDVMSQPVVLTHPKESLAVAASRMAASSIKRLPVVDENGKLVGVLARLDILRQVADAQTKVGRKPTPIRAGRVVRDVMLLEVPTVRDNADLVELVNAFVAANSHRLIVVDENAQPIGLVSDADVVTRIQPAHQRGLLDALQRRADVPASDVTARDVMSPEVLTVTPETSLTDATQKMLAAGRKWMIVVDNEFKPVGLLDRQALLMAVIGRLSNGD